MTDSPLIITCALVGAELSKNDTPYLPLSPDEIARSAKKAVEAGATVIHLHVRDEQGKPTHRLDVFETVTRKIRERCSCIIQYSTGGAVGTPLKNRIAPLSLKPEMASLSMGTLNFGPDIFENTEYTIRAISEAIQKNAVLPELEIFDLGMLDTMKRFLQKKIIPEKFHINFVLGVPGGMAGSPENLFILKDRLSSSQTWSVSGIGRCQLPLTAIAIAAGGHVRVGFEDNIYFRKGELAKSNAQLIKRVSRIAKELDRPIATEAQTRTLLRIES